MILETDACPEALEINSITPLLNVEVGHAVVGLILSFSKGADKFLQLPHYCNK